MQTGGPWRSILSSPGGLLGEALLVDFHLLWSQFHSLFYFSSPWVRIANKQSLRTQWLHCFFSGHSLLLPEGSEFRAPRPSPSHMIELIVRGRGGVSAGRRGGAWLKREQGGPQGRVGVTRESAPGSKNSPPCLTFLTPNDRLISSPDQMEHICLLTAPTELVCSPRYSIAYL